MHLSDGLRDAVAIASRLMSAIYLQHQAVHKMLLKDAGSLLQLLEGVRLPRQKDHTHRCCLRVCRFRGLWA